MEWIYLLNILDSIEHEVTEFNKNKKKEEDLEKSNAIPPSKQSIKDKLFGPKDDKPTKKSQNDQSFDIKLPWANAKKMTKSIRDLMNI